MNENHSRSFDYQNVLEISNHQKAIIIENRSKNSSKTEIIKAVQEVQIIKNN